MMAKYNRLSPDQVETAARLEGVPAALALAVFKQESDLGTNTKTSAKGAVGPFQVTPATFKRYLPGGDIHDPVDNMQAGLAVLKDGLKRGNGDFEKAAQFYYHGKILPPGVEGPTSGPGTPTVRQYGKQVAAKAQQNAAATKDTSGPSLADLGTAPAGATATEAAPKEDMFGMGELASADQPDLGATPEMPDLGAASEMPDLGGYTGSLNAGAPGSFGGMDDVALNEQGSQDYELDRLIRKMVDEELTQNA